MFSDEQPARESARRSSHGLEYDCAVALEPGEERRRNIKALAVVLVVLVVLGAFAYRPATVIGIDGDALAHSIGGGQLVADSTCREIADSRWRCQISSGSDSTTYSVTTKAFGCWEAARLERTGEDDVSVQRSGCINAIDVVSPF